jgi:hypothetical protein
VCVHSECSTHQPYTMQNDISLIPADWFCKEFDCPDINFDKQQFPHLFCLVYNRYYYYSNFSLWNKRWWQLTHCTLYTIHTALQICPVCYFQYSLPSSPFCTEYIPQSAIYLHFCSYGSSQMAKMVLTL